MDNCPLLPNGQGGPQANDAVGQVDPGHEPMNVVQPRRSLRLPEIHLERSARDRDCCQEGQADPNDNLAGSKGTSGMFGLSGEAGRCRWPSSKNWPAAMEHATCSEARPASAPSLSLRRVLTSLPDPLSYLGGP